MNNSSEVLQAKIAEGESVQLMDEAIYMLHPFGWYAYGHLHDSLMRLCSMPDTPNDTNILCCDYRRVVEFEEHIEALGYNRECIIDQRSLPRFIKVSTLHYPVNPGVPTNYTAESYSWMRNRYLTHFVTETEAPKQQIKGLYLSRNSVKAGARGVTNESEVIEILAKNGFTILDGTQSLGEMVQLFSSADLIIVLSWFSFREYDICK
ncbi:glycosyltransferase family 61 protein [Marinomonas sp. GJ51-6]|uniref:glycosyltransferase family 61 protein n=1 Tax=Marinomonas sp. GJ51-6 TaxID=2992802 RepID=UPI0029342594|nr:glycosyltransferase family 61 protein [Marinomonas sp. GJ51-6]WOD06175.1 glycosyltransferase family 61 protein [Marinomonas sp. GJ51-6]